MRSLSLLALALTALPLAAAEHKFNFGDSPLDQPPAGFRSVIVGKGAPGDWKIVLDDAPSQFPPLNSNAAPASVKRAVLAQLARDPADEHFPLLIADDEVYGDFTFTTRFKTVGGAMEQMAGIAFRIQDEKNFYLLRASALGNNVRFYKVVNGERGPLIGPEVPIAKDVWHELSVECEGNHIHCRVDGREIIPMLTDNSFLTGKVGFWTKSDAISYFADAKVVYTPREILAQTLVHDAMKKYPRLLGLKIYAERSAGQGPVLVASHDDQGLGQAGGDVERDVINHAKSYFGRDKKSLTVTAALRDRNGEPIAAVRVTTKAFPGETQDTAVGKVQPIIQEMQTRAPSREDLLK